MNEDIRVGRFHKIPPDHLRVGDIIMCYAHDDQWEQRNARVCEVTVNRAPGVWDIPWPDGSKVEHWAYDYRVTVTARHVSLKRPDAAGGPAFTWGFYPWNSVFRFEPARAAQGEA